MTQFYIIARDVGRNAPVTYFCSDSFWLSRNLATRFETREATEHHVQILSQEGFDAVELHVLNGGGDIV